MLERRGCGEKVILPHYTWVCKLLQPEQKIVWRFLKKKTTIELPSVSSVQSLSPIRLFVTPWTAARQASLSIANSWSLPKLMPIKSVIPSNHLILCRFLLLPSIFPSIRVFSNESVLRIRWPSIAVSASASVLPMNIQDWFPLELNGLISL